MEELVLQLENYVMEAGIWGPIVYVLVMIIAIVISPIPSSPLAIFAGIAFGWVKGMILTLVGATIGAIIAFYIARWFGRPLVEKLVPKRKLAKIERMMPEHRLTAAVFILRIPPLPFFDAVSYAAGLTKIRFKNFVLATFFGLMPIVFVLSYFSEITKNLLYIGVATIIMTLFFFVFVKVYAQKIHKEELEKEKNEHQKN